jgi:hypothetical protein
MSRVTHLFARPGLSIEAMLGAEEGDELDAGGTSERLPRRFAPAIDGSGVADQPDAFAAKRVEVVRFEGIDAGDHARAGGGKKGRVEQGEDAEAPEDAPPTICPSRDRGMGRVFPQWRDRERGTLPAAAHGREPGRVRDEPIWGQRVPSAKPMASTSMCTSRVNWGTKNADGELVGGAWHQDFVLA